MRLAKEIASNNLVCLSDDWLFDGLLACFVVKNNYVSDNLWFRRTTDLGVCIR